MKLNRNQFNALPLRKKITYVVGRAFWHVTLASILLLLVGTLIWKEHFAEPPALCIEMVNASQSVREPLSPAPPVAKSPLRQAAPRRQAAPDMQGVIISKRIQRTGPNQEPRCSQDALLVSSVLSEKNDLYFWDDLQSEFILKSCALTDLRQVLPAELLQQYKNDLVYTAPLLEGGYPFAIRLEHNAWVQNNQHYDSCLVGVDKNSKNLDRATEFLVSILK